MIFVKVDFPAGRWHATAWGSHVNEGVPEWPPCPWRLCRAVIAAWYWKHRRDESILRSLVEKLAAQSPDYSLPQATAAHTRHYMPVVAGPKETKTKVFDTFVHVTAGRSLWIRWDVELNSDERTLLATLLEALNYMGRAESLVSATLENSPPEIIPADEWTVPAERSRLADRGESVRLLTPQLPVTYSEWTAAQNAAADEKARGKKRFGTLPASLFAALQLDTADWKKDGWNIPPGARWVEYLRPSDCFKIAPPTGSSRMQINFPKVARFAIVSKVPPSVTQSLSLAERFHQGLCGILGKMNERSPALIGLDENGVPLKGNSHVYFLPECDQHGYVTHMTLHAPGGFDEAACRAMGKLRGVWGMEGFDVKIILLATGQPDDFSIASPYFHKARIWNSLTPFIPTRHPKATRTGVMKMDEKKHLQIGSPEHDCWRLLETIEPKLPVVSVTSLGTRIKHELRDIPCLDFQRHRRTGNGTRAGNYGYALRLEFAEKVSLPLGLGYGAHFGLGLFVPVADHPKT
jgi:CRISPR-associated protein Csb2